MHYIICSKVIEAAIGNNKYTADLLMPFASSQITHKIVKNNKILDIYKSISDDGIKTWINLITNQNCREEIPCTKDPIFIETCKISLDKQLIVSNKNSDYPHENYEGLNVIDKDEGIHIHRIPNMQINNINNSEINNSTIGDHNK